MPSPGERTAMKRMRCLAVGVLLLAVSGDLAAQVPVYFGPGFGFGGLGFRYARRNLTVGGFFGGFGGYYAPYPFWGGSYYNNITIISPPAPPPTVIVINNNFSQPAAGEEAAARRPGQLLDIDNKVQFDVIRPRKRQPPVDVARKPERDDRQAAPKHPAAQPAPQQAAPSPAQPPPPAAAVVDPIPEIADGKMAFSYGEFGRSERFLRQAVALYPADPRAYFLLSQAEFARARYAEAVATIRSAMKIRRDYPAARFSPTDLYGPNATAFAEHLDRLQDTLARHPRDADLLFLLAHQLWFDGRRDEARKWFQRARPLARDTTLIDRFLNKP